jgi:hypothetical protein
VFHLQSENEVLELAEKIRAERSFLDKVNGPELSKSFIGSSIHRDTETSAAPPNAPINEYIVGHHSPDREQIQRITTIRAAARNFLDAIDANCGSCADATAAKRHVREAMFTANAAIALNGLI